MAAYRRREPDRLPDLAAAARNAIRHIDQSTDTDVKALVSSFLGAAWPTAEAQNQ